MIRFPNAKINIGLNIVSKRPDGFHNLETIFYPVDWTDILEVIPDKNKTTFSASGPNISGTEDSNLCIRAYWLLQKQYKLPPVQIHLHKIIPMGAGLGGGSSDGVTTLLMLNDLFKTGLNEADLSAYALKLGSDCPFFIYNKPVFGTGKGEVITPVDLSLNGYHICILKPAVHITTRDAFTLIKPSLPIYSLKDRIQLPVQKWKDEIANDFEVPVFKEYPEIRLLKEKLYASGALYASLTGSGSAVYGIFREKPLIHLSVPGLISWFGILK